VDDDVEIAEVHGETKFIAEVEAKHLAEMQGVECVHEMQGCHAVYEMDAGYYAHNQDAKELESTHNEKDDNDNTKDNDNSGSEVKRFGLKDDQRRSVSTAFSFESD